MKAPAPSHGCRGWSDALEQYRVRHRAPTTQQGGHPPPEPPVGMFARTVPAANGLDAATPPAPEPSA